MPRIRNTKPEFFRHEGLQDLEVSNPGKYPMLVFSGLWTQADKNGVFPWKPRSLKLDILPFLPFEMADTLELLAGAGFIERFEHDGEQYGYILKFQAHQVISHKERDTPSKFPSPPAGTPRSEPGTIQIDHETDHEDTSTIPEPTQNGSGTVPEPTQNGSSTIPDTADIGHRTYDIGRRTQDTGIPARDEIPVPSRDRSGSAPPPDIVRFRAKDALLEPLRQSFLALNTQGFTDPGAEEVALRALSERFMRMGRDDPLDFTKDVLSAFYTLVTGRDKFWSRQPFLASVLVKPGIFDRVLTELRAIAAVNDWPPVEAT